MYLSFGLMKRMKINWSNVEGVIDDPALLQQKLSKDTIDFIARDLEAVFPHVIVKLKRPAKAIWMFGIEKEYRYVAIRVDEPQTFKAVLTAKIDHS